jgi:hypothetical protein
MDTSSLPESPQASAVARDLQSAAKDLKKCAMVPFGREEDLNKPKSFTRAACRAWLQRGLSTSGWFGSEFEQGNVKWQFRRSHGMCDTGLCSFCFASSACHQALAEGSIKAGQPTSSGPEVL